MNLLTGQFGFLRWWTVLLPQAIIAKGRRSVSLVGDAFAVKQMLQHINEPIFQDPTWQGRLIGIGIRIMRIVIGLLAEGVTTLALGALLVLWYLFPLIALWGILR